MTSLTFTAGRLLCGPIREYLRRRRFLDQRIEFIESKGIFERTFSVKGPEESILRMHREIALLANKE